MAVLLKCNAVFLHLPKTGGTFLRRLFETMDLYQFDFSRDHADMKRVVNISKHYPGNYLLRSFQLRKNLETHVRDCYKFTFVRHPFDWYESYWRFMEDIKWFSFTNVPPRTRFGFPRDTWHPFSPIEKHGTHDFNEFIERVIKYAPGYLTKMYDGYTTPGQIDYVGKQETLLHDICHIFDHLQVTYDPYLINSLSKENKSNTPKPEWTKSNKENMYKLEKELFLKYNYEFK